jgi:hypothetical protein
MLGTFSINLCILAQHNAIQHQQTQELLQQTNLLSQETGSNIGVELVRISKILILKDAPMAQSRILAQAQSKHEGCRDEFIDSWLDSVSTVGDTGHHGFEDDQQIGDRTGVGESAKVVPSSIIEDTYFKLPEMSLDDYIRETFTFGNFHGHLVLSVSIPKRIWANIGYDHEPHDGLDEFTSRRYTALTAEPKIFDKKGLFLRQQSLRRDIERLVAIPIYENEDISSYEVAEKVKKVTDDVRALVKHVGDVSSWKRIVVGFFISHRAFGQKKISPDHCSNCVFTDIGVLAEWPVKVTSPTSEDFAFCGNHAPTHVRFVDGEGSKRTFSEQLHVKAHLYEVGNTTARRFVELTFPSLLHLCRPIQSPTTTESTVL